MSGGGSSSPSSNTTVQSQQIPEYEQQFSQQNQALAQSLGAQPYPQYPGALIQPMNGWQSVGEGQAIGAAGAYAPYMNNAGTALAGATDPSTFNGALQMAQLQGGNALNGSTGVFNSLGSAQGQVGQAMAQAPGVFGAYGQQAGALGQASNLTNPNAISGYMSPFISQALAPQVQQLQLQLAQQQQGINATAAQSGAYGDARQGAAQSLQNLYGNQALTQMLGTGYNSAYSQALSAMGQAQNTQLGVAQGYGNIGQGLQGEQNVGLQGANLNMGIANSLQGEQGVGLNYANMMNQQASLANQQQQTQMQGANLWGTLGGLAQQYGITGANATYNVGQQQQTLGQNELNAAYQQYLNQINWPYQMLNVQEGALSNSPYNIATATTLPSANQTAQGFGTIAGAAGLLGGLTGGGGANAPFGGQVLQ